MNLMNLDPETRDYLIQQYRLSGDPAMARAVKVADMAGGAVDAYSGLTDDFVRGGQKALMGIAPNKTGAVARMAVNPAFKGALRALPAVGALGGVMGAADVLAGDGSTGKKIRDGTAMTIGGILGAAGGPVGIAAGAGAGKMVSDVGGWLLGEKSAEEIRMEEALAQLRGLV